MSLPEPTGAERRRLLGLVAAGLAGLAGCATHPGASPAVRASGNVAPFSSAPAGELPVGWRPYVMRADRAVTHYRLVNDGPGQVLYAKAESAGGGLQCHVDIDPQRQGVLRFSWKVPRAPSEASLAVDEHGDSPARVILGFEGDGARLSVRERLFYEQVELFTGHRLPFATLMYIWDGQLAPGTVTPDHRSSRIHFLTVESGAARAGQWLHYRRDVVADFRRVYGEAPGRISSVGVLTDSDALKLELEAWYGDITLLAG